MMSTVSDAHVLRRLMVLFLSSLATLCEWYDYALYGCFATIIAKNFFPSEDNMASLLSMFSVFATGFAMRPLGAIVFGYMGDRIGRGQALASSVLMMAVSTTLIGLLPTYQQIGWYAALVLVLVRLLQGFAVGGNYGGAFVTAIEQAPVGRKSLFGSLPMVGTISGIFFGSAVAMLSTHYFEPEVLVMWGWRLPFVLSLITGSSGVLIYRYISDNPQVKALLEQQRREARQWPIREIWRTHKKDICTAVFVILPDVVGIYITFFFMNTYLTNILGWSSSVALMVNMMGLAVMTVFIPFFGWLSDKIGSMIVMRTVIGVFIVCSVPLFSLFQYHQVGLLFFYAACFCCCLKRLLWFNACDDCGIFSCTAALYSLNIIF